jgi:integrase
MPSTQDTIAWLRKPVRGRRPMVTIPDVQPSSAWQDAWLGFELDMLARGRSPKTISSRHSTIMILARRMTAQSTDPAGVTKALMQRYMVAELAGRRHSGALTVYNDLRQFWSWYAEEYEAASPMTGIPRPKGSEAPVKVLTPDQIKAILGACSGRSWEDIRNRAMVLLLLETGLRRSELLALTPGDIDVKDRRAVVQRGKGGRARVAVFGPDTAQALHRWLRKRGDGPGALFLGRRGADLTSSGLGQFIVRLSAKAGVPGLHCHQFRHSWTHYLLDDGTAEGDVCQLAGWTTRKQLGRYGASMAQQRAIAAGLAHPVARLVNERGRAS